MALFIRKPVDVSHKILAQGWQIKNTTTPLLESEHLWLYTNSSWFKTRHLHNLRLSFGLISDPILGPRTPAILPAQRNLTCSAINGGSKSTGSLSESWVISSVLTRHEVVWYPFTTQEKQSSHQTSSDLLDCGFWWHMKVYGIPSENRKKTLNTNEPSLPVSLNTTKRYQRYNPIPGGRKQCCDHLFPKVPHPIFNKPNRTSDDFRSSSTLTGELLISWVAWCFLKKCQNPMFFTKASNFPISDPQVPAHLPQLQAFLWQFWSPAPFVTKNLEFLEEKCWKA